MPTVFVTGADQADWRDERSYGYTARLTQRGWAWEFLRRNPAFQRDLLAARQQANALSRESFLDVIAWAGDLSRWGVLFRRVFWAQCGRVLVSAPVRPCAAGHCGTAVCILDDIAVRPGGLPCRATVLLAPDNSQNVLLGNAEHTLQLAVSGADILHPVCLRTEAIWSAILSKHRLRALECLSALSLGQQLPARLFPPEKRGPV
ncbi:MULTISPECIES: transcriptional regulator domain-containing protein [Mesorhizobium]|uniref:transcriptional regulator domain-containing protein n=1 Tax=Mesorhizobium TaxID=68287 RepID=UPI001FCE4CF0|nr:MULTISPECIES: DUF6499 domain-containing protein [Mesorhizobium]